MCEQVKVTLRLAGREDATVHSIAGWLTAEKAAHAGAHAVRCTLFIDGRAISLGGPVNITEAPDHVFRALREVLMETWKTGRHVLHVVDDQGEPLLERECRPATAGVARWLTQYTREAVPNLRLIK
jgi:hypothetical protein